MKKIIATVLAMVMALALCTTAFAASTYTDAYKWDSSTNKWEKYDLTGKSISYTSAVENKTNDKVTSGSVGYYTVGTDTYVEVKSDDDTATLRLKVDGTQKYLAPLTNVADASYTLIGTKVESSTACGKIAVKDSSKTLYVSSSETTANYYVTGTGFNMLVDGKVVKVAAAHDGTDYEKNAHSFKLVSTSTASDVTTGTAKCEKCGLVANVTNKPSAIPSGATVSELGGGLFAYYTEGSTVTPSTGTTTSPKTFDAGIAMYVGMALTSVAGSAVVIGKKKEF